MYSRALSKLAINRQFENAVKESSLDCVINKYGNIIRLDERYEPEPSQDGLFKIYYENYSSGAKYIRKGLKSAFNKTTPEGILTMEDLFNNTALKSTSLEFVNIFNSEKLTLTNKSLIIMEDIDCNAGNVDYSFNGIPEKIVNLTINKEMIPLLMKIPLSTLKKILSDLEKGVIKADDPKLDKKIKRFYSKEALTEKQIIIEKLKAIGIGEDETPWDLESPEALRKLYKSITGKKAI